MYFSSFLNSSKFMINNKIIRKFSAVISLVWESIPSLLGLFRAAEGEIRSMEFHGIAAGGNSIDHRYDFGV